MKNKERIAILEAEISRLKVANRNNTYRLEAIESHLAEQHKGANFSKLNSSEIPNTCEPIKPDFIPDWKDAPEDAVCVAMDGNGDWFWYDCVPRESTSIFGLDGATCRAAGKATNAHLLPPDYWKSTLMMRPEAEKDYTHLLPDGYEFCKQGEHERFVKVEMIDGIDEEEQNELGAISQTGGKQYLPIRKSSPDYSHLLPEGYEFCQEQDAVKWVKVEMMEDDTLTQCSIGRITECPGTIFEPYYRPIRPIQYKVTTHEIVTAVPDPYMPDWSKAPEGTVAHAFDESKVGIWYIVSPEDYEFVKLHEPSPFTLPADLDWKQSLRVKPN